MKKINITVPVVSMLLTALTAVGETTGVMDSMEWSAEAYAGIGSGDFAPYHISSLRHGRVSSSSAMYFEGSVIRSLSDTRRYDWGFGADLITGYASDVDYQRYDADDHSWYYHSMRPSSARVQQLYAEGRWRSIFLTAGMKERGSRLVNNKLSSGDLTYSGNTVPMPEIRMGFNDFQNIPLTSGWLQIQGEVAIGKRMDNKWVRNHYNYYNFYLSQGEWMNYKSLYLRSNPAKPFSMLIGMQAVAEFWGSTVFYKNGEPINVHVRKKSFGSLWRSFIPTEDGKEGFYEGNHLGSIDVKGRYRLRSGDRIKAYVSWPWEDGSGLGKLNGWDGLWGLEYRSGRRGLINGAVLEILSFTNHSGHIHFNPADVSSEAIFPGHVSGCDDYYNHVEYNSYAYYGLSIGSPAFMGPLYNRDGYNRFIGNVMRGFHFALEGSLSSQIDYIAKCSYRKAWGSGYFHLAEPIHESSFMVGADWCVPKIKGLKVNGMVEIDRGTMPGNALGIALGVKWTGHK